MKEKLTLDQQAEDNMTDIQKELSTKRGDYLKLQKELDMSDEMVKADNTMTDSQKKLSKSREGYVNFLKSINKTGFLDQISFDHYKGEINGHKIEILGNSADGWTARVDEQWIERGDAESLAEKYCTWLVKHSTWDLEDANKEIKEHAIRKKDKKNIQDAVRELLQ